MKKDTLALCWFPAATGKEAETTHATFMLTVNIFILISQVISSIRHRANPQKQFYVELLDILWKRAEGARCRAAVTGTTHVLCKFETL